MFRNMVTSLFKHERIRTTDVKAKELRRWADNMITLAKRGDLHARRQVLAIIMEKQVAHKLFEEAAERFGTVSGGYTRIVKLGRRAGDAAPISMIELISPETAKKKKKVKKKKKAKDVAEKKPTVDTKSVEEERAKEEVKAEAEQKSAIEEKTAEEKIETSAPEAETAEEKAMPEAAVLPEDTGEAPAEQAAAPAESGPPEAKEPETDKPEDEKEDIDPKA